MHASYKYNIFFVALFFAHGTITEKRKETTTVVYYGYNDARKRANEKYLSEKVDSITVRVKKGRKEELKRLADEKGISLNELISKTLDCLLQNPELLD